MFLLPEHQIINLDFWCEIIDVLAIIILSSEWFGGSLGGSLGVFSVILDLDIESDRGILVWIFFDCIIRNWFVFLT